MKLTEKEKKKPFVTVLMCCFNAQKWLPYSVPSVLNQTFKDFEFIIVDDGSTDETLNIIQKFAAYDSRIIIIKKNNSGPGDARNTGLKIARGDWIAVIDADDVFEAIKLEKQVEAAKANSKLVYIGTGLSIIDSLGNVNRIHNYPTSHSKLKKNLITAKKFPPHSSALYKTSAVNKLGGYHTRVSQAEDADLWLRLSEVGEMTCLTGAYVKIRKHAEQISHIENGKHQMLDARIATVASWLRHYGYVDPTVANDTYFKEYCDWIDLQLQNNNLYNFLSFKAKLNSYIIAVARYNSSFFFLILLIIKNPFLTIRCVKERVFGESLPHRLALKWINYKNHFNAELTN